MINKKGQSLGLGILSFMFIVLAGFLCINFLNTEITNGIDNLDCSNTAGISDGTKLLCLGEYLILPYWIWIIIAVGISAITVRYVL